MRIGELNINLSIGGARAVLGMLEIPMSQKGLQRAEPVKKIFVLLPAWNRLDWRRASDFLKRLPFHLQIRPRVNLGCFDIFMAEEVADHVKRDSALQQVHSLCVSERVRTPIRFRLGRLFRALTRYF